MQTSDRDEGLAWQTGIWDRMSEVYPREIDPRLAPVVDHLIGLAGLKEGERVLDLGTGTGAVAEKAALAVGPRGTSSASTPVPRCSGWLGNEPILYRSGSLWPKGPRRASLLVRHLSTSSSPRCR